MNVTWVKKTADARRVVVIFGGWAIGPDVFSAIAGNEDVLFVSDYRTLSGDLPDLSAYEMRALVAWSFGVAAFAHWQADRPARFERTIAIAGSETPVDDLCGIPTAIFEKTVATLSAQSYQGFLMRCHNRRVAEQAIDIDARREELIAVRARGAAPSWRWDRVYIAVQDRIFPPASLQRAYADRALDLCPIEAPHVCFGAFPDWDAVLR